MPSAYKPRTATMNDYIGHNYTGHKYIGHKYTGNKYIGHNYIGHQYIGHNYIGHKYIGRNYTGQYMPWLYRPWVQTANDYYGTMGQQQQSSAWLLITWPTCRCCIHTIWKIFFPACVGVGCRPAVRWASPEIKIWRHVSWYFDRRLLPHAIMACVVMACEDMAYVVMACVVMAYVVLAYVVMPV